MSDIINVLNQNLLSIIITFIGIFVAVIVIKLIKLIYHASQLMSVTSTTSQKPRNTKVISSSFKINPCRRFNGVELEVLSTSNSISEETADKLNFHKHYDGSLSSGGEEFSSYPMNGDILFKSIKEFCDKLIINKYTIDTSCGFHAHFQVPKNDLEYLKKIFFFYNLYEPLFYQLVSKSRKNNKFCSSINKTYPLNISKLMQCKTLIEFKKIIYQVDTSLEVKEEQQEHTSDKRYSWLNLHSIFYRGTLEIRLHNGTINPNKVLFWLKIHNEILDYLKINSLSNIMKLSPNKEKFLSIFCFKTRRYILERMQYLRYKQSKEYREDEINGGKINV